MPALKRSEDADTEMPQPIVYRESAHERVLGFGKPLDWSFRPLSSGLTEPELRKLPPSLYLPKIAVEYGLGKFLYAPIPTTFNALMCTESELMAKRVELRSELYHTNVWLMRGAYADGLLLSKNSAYVVSLAGCPLIKVRGRGTQLGVAHAGRDSLIDRGKLEGKTPRKFESIVMSLTQAMLRAGSSANDLEVEILFSIDPNDFPHPWSHEKYGEFNKRMIQYIAQRWGRKCILNYDDPKKRAEGKIDPAAVIRSQFISLGVLPKKITSTPAPPRDKWADTREDNGSSLLVRNMAIVQNL